LKRILDHDELTGVTEIFHYDELTKEIHIESRQDVAPMLDLNKQLQNDEQYSKNGIKNEMWNYAFVPILVQLKWINEYGLHNDPMRKENKELLFRLLNSREWRHLKRTNKIHLPR
jgi:hypothetical protein